MNRFSLFLLLIILTISGCAAKTVVDDGGMINDKSVVLENLMHNASPATCDYTGRVNLHYLDPNNDVSTSAIMQKKCDGRMVVRALGPFGITVAEMIVDKGIYTARQGKKDVTESIVIDPNDMILLEQYLRLPPPMPDSSYTMVITQGIYMFLKGDNIYSVSQNFKINGFFNPDHKVGYIWGDGGRLKAMTFARQNTSLSVEFVDPWKITTN